MAAGHSRLIGWPRSREPGEQRVTRLGHQLELHRPVGLLLNDRRARSQHAAYGGSYKDIQLDFFGLYEDVINGVRTVTTRTTSDTVNAPGTGRLRGFEAEFTLAPVTDLTLSASYAYNDVRIPPTRIRSRKPPTMVSHSRSRSRSIRSTRRRIRRAERSITNCH
jgi:hypothetical protein